MDKLRGLHYFIVVLSFCICASNAVIDSFFYQLLMSFLFGCIFIAYKTSYVFGANEKTVMFWSLISAILILMSENLGVVLFAPTAAMMVTLMVLGQDFAYSKDKLFFKRKKNCSWAGAPIYILLMGSYMIVAPFHYGMLDYILLVAIGIVMVGYFFEIEATDKANEKLWKDAWADNYAASLEACDFDELYGTKKDSK